MRKFVRGVANIQEAVPTGSMRRVGAVVPKSNQTIPSKRQRRTKEQDEEDVVPSDDSGSSDGEANKNVSLNDEDSEKYNMQVDGPILFLSIFSVC